MLNWTYCVYFTWRLERYKRETRERLERDYRKTREREMERAREEIWSYLDNLYTDRQMDKQTDGHY